MSYLQDKKARSKKFLNAALVVMFFFLIFYFRAGILSEFSGAARFLLRPVVIFGNFTGEKFSNIVSILHSKSTLLRDIENLKAKLGEQEAALSNYNSILDENEQMKEILNRKAEKPDFLLAAILSKPNQNPYDTLTIDVGEKDKVETGDRVFALGNVPIGRVAEVYGNSSKVILYSSPGEKTEVVISKNIFTEAVGRGGGNFEIALIGDLAMEKGMEADLPGTPPHVLGIVQTITSDPRDPYQKALLASPVNLQELKFVEVER